MLVRTTRRSLATAALPTVALALAGCEGPGSGEDDAPSDNPAVGDAAQMGDLRLASPAFEDGEAIPIDYGRDAENVNPPLSIGGVPSDAESLVLIFDDADAGGPHDVGFLHWLVWNVPPDTSDVPEGWTPTEASEGRNDFGRRGYGGPAPPEEHRYRFKLYAVDAELDLPHDAGIREAGEAMEDHLLARAQLEGTYAP